MLQKVRSIDIYFRYQYYINTRQVTLIDAQYLHFFDTVCCRRFRLHAAIDGEAMKIQPSRFGWYDISSQGKINEHDSYILENGETSIMYDKNHGWRVRYA